MFRKPHGNDDWLFQAAVRMERVNAASPCRRMNLFAKANFGNAFSDRFYTYLRSFRLDFSQPRGDRFRAGKFPAFKLWRRQLTIKMGMLALSAPCSGPAVDRVNFCRALDGGARRASSLRRPALKRIWAAAAEDRLASSTAKRFRGGASPQLPKPSTAVADFCSWHSEN